MLLDIVILFFLLPVLYTRARAEEEKLLFQRNKIFSN